MKLSIITVNYNNEEGLKRTIDSIKNQTIKDFEYIIIDGNSSDSSVNIIKENESHITYWVSERDTGIYHAMNKGVRIAKGDYCIFINSGDEFYENCTIEKILNEKLDSDYIQGTIFTTNGKFKKAPKKIGLSFYIYGMNNFHQASIISRKVLLKCPYDETLRIASDLKFNIQNIILNNCTYRNIDIVIAKYEVGGRSGRIDHREELDKIFKELIPQRISDDYQEMSYNYYYPGKYISPIIKKICTLRLFNLLRTLLRK